jgi:hypothetical protein
MRNYVTPAVGNYVLTSALQLGNYVIADSNISEVLTEHYRRTHPEVLGIPAP